MIDAIHPIVMPKWGLAMEEGTVVAWLVDQGADVQQGGDLIEVETSKINNVVETPAGGILRRQVAGEGQTVSVGMLLGVIADAVVADDQIDQFVQQFNEQAAVAAAETGELQAPEMQSVEAGHCIINYMCSGSDDGPPVLLVHGFGGDSNNWLFTLPALAVSRTTYAVDLPGHGRSGKQITDGSVDGLMRILIDFLDQLSLDQVHVVGHSLGGAIGLSLAAAHPTRVVGLTLIAPAGLGKDINSQFIEGFLAAKRYKPLKVVLEMLFADSGMVNRAMADDILRFKRLDGVVTALQTIAAAAFTDGEQTTVLRSNLRSLKIPVQVIWGHEDRIVPAAHANGLPDHVAVHLIAGAGHMVHMEKAAEVNEIILGLHA